MLSLTFTSYLLFGLTVATCSHRTHLQRHVDEPAFGYDVSKGPLTWYKLSDNNTACRGGRNQSPIDIGGDIGPTNRSISINYDERMDGMFENLGTTIEVTPDSKKDQNFSITLGSQEYDLKQFHLHTPSEHRLDGEAFPLEMHLVHESPDEEILVLGLLFDAHSLPQTNTFLTRLADFAPRVRENGASVEVTDISMAGLIDAVDTTSLATYSGSLTTPPCSEDVTWLVHQVPLEINSHSFQSFKRVLKFNSRIIQGHPGEPNAEDDACSSKK